MKPSLAFLYAIISIVLMVSISYFISLRMALPAIAMSVITLLFIGSGFILKARLRRNNNSTND